MTTAQLQAITLGTNFNILLSAGVPTYPVTNAALDSGGDLYASVSPVLGSSGTSYNPI
jgi:hypothetical protein